VRVDTAGGLNTGGSGLTFSNNGTLEFTGSFWLSDPLTLNAGGGTIDTNSNSNTLSGVISGAGALTKTGTGTLMLAGVNVYTGVTKINGGTVSVLDVNSLGAPGSGLSFDGGTLYFTSNFTLPDAIVLNAGGGTIDGNFNHTLSGVISGTGALTKTEAQTLTLSGVNTTRGQRTFMAVHWN